MPNQKITAFFKQCPVIELPKDQIIAHYQQSSPYIYKIKSGFIQISSLFNRSHNPFPLAIIPPGEIIPLTAITHSDSPIKYILTSITPVTIYRSSLTQFLDFTQTEPEIQTYLQAKIYQILYDLINHLEILLNCPAEEKIFQVLIYLIRNFSRQTKAGNTLKFPLTHKKLAAFCILSRETTTKIVNKLIKQGVIQDHNHYFSVNLCNLDYKTHC